MTLEKLCGKICEKTCEKTTDKTNDKANDKANDKPNDGIAKEINEIHLEMQKLFLQVPSPKLVERLGELAKRLDSNVKPANEIVSECVSRGVQRGEVWLPIL